VRYPDDFVVMCRSREEAEAARKLAGEVLAGLGLELHPDKTRIVDLREGREASTSWVATCVAGSQGGGWSAGFAATTSIAGRRPGA
jgi:hypothetical protein